MLDQLSEVTKIETDLLNSCNTLSAAIAVTILNINSNVWKFFVCYEFAYQELFMKAWGMCEFYFVDENDKWCMFATKRRLILSYDFANIIYATNESLHDAS
jgi:hypothetical protein